MFTQARATAVAASRSTDPRLSASRKARNGVRKARDQRVSPEKSSRCVGIAWKYPANADGPPGKPVAAEVQPRIYLAVGAGARRRPSSRRGVGQGRTGDRDVLTRRSLLGVLPGFRAWWGRRSR